MAVGDFFLIETITQVNGVNAANAYYYEQTVDESPSSVTDPAAAWMNSMAPTWAALASIESAITCVTSKQLAPVEDPAYPLFVSEPGTVTGDCLPATSILTISYYGFEEPARIIRTRNTNLISGIAESIHTDNNINSVGIILAKNFVAQALLPIVSPAGGTYEPRVREVFAPGPPAVYKWHVKERGIINPQIRSAVRRTTDLCNPT